MMESLRARWDEIKRAFLLKEERKKEEELQTFHAGD